MTKCECMRGCNEDGSNYTWYPRKDPKTIKQCPNCKAKAWRIPRPEPVESLEERNKREVEESCGNKSCEEHGVDTYKANTDLGGRCS